MDAVMQTNNSPKRAAQFLHGILRNANPKRRGGLYELQEAWSRAAGSDVACQSHIVGLVRDTLTVAVESPALRQEIETFRKDHILARLAEEFPAKRIATLKCVLRGSP